MKLVILAAGKGERLWPLTRNTPKCLMEIGNGMTLLESQLMSIQSCDEIEELILVTGYLSEQIEAKVKAYRTDGLKITTVYNPFYDMSNNLVSLWFAMPHVNDRFVVVNGDDLFNPQVLQGLVDAPENQNITMVISRKDHYDDDDMKVIERDQHITQVGKDIALEEATAESIGMIRFLGRGSSKIRHILEAQVRTPEGKQVFWLKAIQQAIDEGIPVHSHVCADSDWAEMDFHPDREMIRENLGEYAPIVSRWLEER